MRKIVEIRYPYPPYRLKRAIERKRQRKVEKTRESERKKYMLKRKERDTKHV